MSIDHTREFHAVAARLAAAAPAGGASVDAARNGSGTAPAHRAAASASSSASDVLASHRGSSGVGGGTHSRSTFMRAVAEISRELQSTSSKLSKLTRLVRRRGMFDDVSSEVDVLTNSLTKELTDTHARVAALEAYISERKARAERAGVKPGRPARGEEGDMLSSVQGLTHAHAVMSSLRAATLTTTQGLKDTLAARGDAIRSAAARGGVAAGGRDLGRPVAMDTVVNVGDASTTLVPFAPVQALVPQSGEAVYASARAADARLLESHMAEISTLFSRLSTLVAEQGESVDRIEDNLDTSVRDVESGTAQLTRALMDARSGRTLVLRVSAVLVLAVILFVLFGL